MSVHEHKKNAPRVINCKIITVSDTREKDTDKSGRLIIELLENSGHQIVDYTIVPDDASAITEAILKGSQDERINAMITNGGTGIAKRDVTIETVQQLFEKEVTGFGELFRLLSYQEDIGSAAILSRAIAGIVNNKVVFSIPGSSGAVKLAMNKLILPELSHIVGEIQKDLR